MKFVGIVSTYFILPFLCVNKQRPHRRAQVKASYSELAVAGRQPLSLAFQGDSKAGRGVEELYSGEREGSLNPRHIPTSLQPGENSVYHTTLGCN